MGVEDDLTHEQLAPSTYVLRGEGDRWAHVSTVLGGQFYGAQIGRGKDVNLDKSWGHVQNKAQVEEHLGRPVTWPTSMVGEKLKRQRLQREQGS